MKKHLIYILLLLPLLAMQCKKDTTHSLNNTAPCAPGDTLCELAKLPPITTTGANTFGCLLNGKAWISKPGGYERNVQGDYYNGELTFSGGRYYNSKYHDKIIIDFFKSVRTDTMLHFTNDGSIRIRYDKFYEEYCHYDNRTTSYFGILGIHRLDTINRIVSAEFEVTIVGDSYDILTEEFCYSDTNYITHGRADILFKL
jgi:hypothetical protein